MTELANYLSELETSQTLNAEITKDNVVEFLKEKNTKGSTALHILFAKGDHENIIKLLDFLYESSDDDKLDVLGLVDNGGSIPLYKIFEVQRPVDVLGKIEGHDLIKELFLAKETKSKTFLHSAVAKKVNIRQKTKFDQTIEKTFEIAKNKSFLIEFLTQKNQFGSSAVYEAVTLGKKDILDKVFQIDGLDVDDLFDKSKTTKDVTLLHAAFSKENIEIMNLLLEKYNGLEKLASKGNGGVIAVKMLLENKNFTTILPELNKKEEIVDSIASSILSNEVLKKINSKKKADLKEQITALWKVIEAVQDEAEKGILKAKLLEAVDLDTKDYTATDFFDGPIIKAKLAAVEAEIVSTVNSLQDASITAEALKDDALDKIGGYITKFKDKLPANFGDSVKTTVTSKLGVVVDAQKTAIGAEGVNDKDGLEKAYTTAKGKIEGFKDVYKALDNDTTNTECSKINSCNNAITSLNEAVFKTDDSSGKAIDLVNKVCKDDYSQVQGDDTAKAQAAIDCKTLIEGFRGNNTLKEIVGNGFAEDKLRAAEQYIEANSFKLEDLGKLAVLVYSHKYADVIKGEMEKYVALTNDQEKNEAMEALQEKCVPIKTSFVKKSEYLPGFGGTSVDTFGKFNSKDYAQIYTSLANAESFENYTTESSIYKSDFTNADSSTEGNKKQMLEEACKIASKSGDDCTYDNMHTFAVAELNKLGSEDVTKADSISQCILKEGFTSMDANALWINCIESNVVEEL